MHRGRIKVDRDDPNGSTIAVEDMLRAYQVVGDHAATLELLGEERKR